MKLFPFMSFNQILLHCDQITADQPFGRKQKSHLVVLVHSHLFNVRFAVNIYNQISPQKILLLQFVVCVRFPIRLFDIFDIFSVRELEIGL